MCDLRKKFTENAEQFDSLMVEMLEENKRLAKALKTTNDELYDWCMKGGGKNSHFIMANNLKLLGVVDP